MSDDFVNLELHVSDLDDILDALENYGFQLSSQKSSIASGRSQVMFALYERILKTKKQRLKNQ